jgi:anaerobic ribonucleoside-triphosphate reductase
MKEQKVEKVETKEEKKVGEGVQFERIRRITGYLVGTVDRFNNGKRAEENDRVKHDTSGIA